MSPFEKIQGQVARVDHALHTRLWQVRELIKVNRPIIYKCVASICIGCLAGFALGNGNLALGGISTFIATIGIFAALSFLKDE